MRNSFYLVISLMIMILLISCSEDDSNDCENNIRIGLVSVSKTIATLKWDETQGYASNYEYGEKGFTLGNGIRGNTEEEIVILTDLKPGTEYDFYLQSQCGVSDFGEWISNPYVFITTECTNIKPENIGGGFIDYQEYRMFWISNILATYEVAMIPSENEIRLEDIFRTSQNNYTISNILSNTSYTLYIRSICGDITGEWITKTIITEPTSCIAPKLSPVGVDFDCQSGYLYVFLMDPINTEFQLVFLESGNGQDIEDGLKYHTTASETDSYISIDYNCGRVSNAGFWNYIYEEGKRAKPSTLYDFYIRTKCSEDVYSSETYIGKYTTAKCNEVDASATIINDQVALNWAFPFNPNHMSFPYLDSYYFDENVWCEIEYGIEGFINGEGTIVNIEPDISNYNILLSELESTTTYEFTVRAKCNNLSYGNYSERVKITTN